MISGESWSGMAEKLVLFNWNRDSNLSLLHHDNSFISLIKGRAPPQGCLLNPCTHFCLSRRDAFAHPARSFGPRRSFLWPGHRLLRARELRRVHGDCGVISQRRKRLPSGKAKLGGKMCACDSVYCMYQKDLAFYAI